MAIWQYKLICSVKTDDLINLKSIYRELFIHDLERLFWNIISQNKMNIYLWDDERDDCNIFLERNKITEIIFRFHLQYFEKEKIKLLINLVEKWKLKLIDQEGVKIPLNFKDFILFVSKSPSNKFLKDPLWFLKNKKILLYKKIFIFFCILLSCLIITQGFIQMNNYIKSRPEYICNKNDWFWTGVDGCENLCTKDNTAECSSNMMTFWCWCGMDGCWDGKKCRPKSK